MNHRHLVHPPVRPRSFVRRASRITEGQARALKCEWQRYGLARETGLLNYEQIFQREAPRLLEIGFGSGQSFLALAKAHPDKDFIGIEPHRPGVGAVCLGIERDRLSNIRLYCDDAIDVLQTCIPSLSIDSIQIFFPDPWPKRKHHPRRLIRKEVVSLLVDKLKIGGTLHLATDWADYARQMLVVLSQEPRLLNMADQAGFACTRSPYRPVITKFEQRALREGRAIWELQARRVIS